MLGRSARRSAGLPPRRRRSPSRRRSVPGHSGSLTRRVRRRLLWTDDLLAAAATAGFAYLRRRQQPPYREGGSAHCLRLLDDPQQLWTACSTHVPIVEGEGTLMSVRRVLATSAVVLLAVSVLPATPADAGLVVQQTDVGAYTLTSGRLWSLVAIVLGLVGVVSGGLGAGPLRHASWGQEPMAVRRPGRRAGRHGRRRAGGGRRRRWPGHRLRHRRRLAGVGDRADRPGSQRAGAGPIPPRAHGHAQTMIEGPASTD